MKVNSVNIQQLDRCVERVNKLLLFLAAMFLIVTVAIVIANVVSRYLLHVSLAWSAELARYAMVWSALLGAAVLVNRRQHLGVDVLHGFVRGRLHVATELIVGIGSMTFYLILLVSGWLLVMRTSGQVASSIEMLPMNAVYAVIPLSALLMLLGSLALLPRAFHDQERTR